MSDFLAALEAALDQVETEWADAPANTGSIYDLPPDGEYEALTTAFEFIEYKKKDDGSGGGVGIKVSYQVTNHNQYAGRICGDLMTISPERLPWLKGWLAKMNVDVDTLDLRSELRPGSATFNALLDTPVLIKVKRSQGKVGSASEGKTFENVYLQQVLGEWGSGAAASGGTNGFTPIRPSDVTTPQDAFSFAPSPARQRAADDDIPF